MDVNELTLSKLQTEQTDPKEEPVNMTDSLIPPLITKALEETAEKNDSDELSKVEKRQQEEKMHAVYQRRYVGQLSEEEESDTESAYSGYSYFG